MESHQLSSANPTHPDRLAVSTNRILADGTTTQTFVFSTDKQQRDKGGPFVENLKADANAGFFAGKQLSVGRYRWQPDYVMVICPVHPLPCTLRLIEVERAEAVASLECRKYGYEPAAEFISTFLSFLERTIMECRHREDPRYTALEQLKCRLYDSPIQLRTACATPDSVEFLEDHPWGGPLPSPLKPKESPTKKEPPEVSGVAYLTRVPASPLRRGILALDALVRGMQSDAELQTFFRRHSQRLRKLLKNEASRFPELYSFFKQDSLQGLKVDCERLSLDLSQFWTFEGKRRMEGTVIKKLIQKAMVIVRDNGFQRSGELLSTMRLALKS